MFSSNASQVSNDANYIEDVFSTYLYTGNGSTQTITNGIDLAGEGGMVWLKCRNSAENNEVYDTARGANLRLITNTTGAQVDRASSMSFNSNGISWVGDNISNTNGNTYASWTFRKQPKFFDIQTWTGNSTARTISHSLGSAPGCIIVKAISASGYQWAVYHRSLAAGNIVWLNLTDASTASSNTFTTTAPTSTEFSLGSASGVNDNGVTYVAYLFAHNAGGFGLTGTDNVISCGSGSWSGGSDNVVNLGYEVQWLMYKRTDDVGNWMMWDVMRGMSFTASEFLRANLSDAAGTFNSPYAIYPTATGFTVPAGVVSTGNYIYIAIRRGPMKVPTTGTSVFTPIARTGTGTAVTVTGVGFTPDLLMGKRRTLSAGNWWDRLRGAGKLIVPSTTAAEATDTSAVSGFDVMDGINLGADTSNGYINGPSTNYANWFFRRAPGFFDEVCYTGTGAAQSINHNLTVAPELMMVKKRNGTSSWIVYSQTLGIGNYLVLNDAGGANASGLWGGVAPTASVFTLGTNGNINASGDTFVWYGFASCPGVSKVGSVTHVEPTTVVCGFTPRFVLIKSTATTGTDDWFVFDSARGITSGNDPYLRLNSTGAENTPFGAADLIDPTADGFIMNGFGGGNYIYLAIA